MKVEDNQDLSCINAAHDEFGALLYVDQLCTSKNPCKAIRMYNNGSTDVVNKYLVITSFMVVCGV
jgi:hypothetical protein